MGKKTICLIANFPKAFIVDEPLRKELLESGLK